MSADRTALTLTVRAVFKCLLTVMSKDRWCVSLRDAEGQPVTGMKDQIKTELTFKPAGNIVTRTLKATKSRQANTGEFTETEAGCISLSLLPERSQVRQRLLLALMA